MRRLGFLAVAFVLLFFTSCAKHIYVDYQNHANGTGTVVLKPSKPTERTFVTINDSLIVDKKFAKSVTIKNVPQGNYLVNYISENSWYKEKLDAKFDINLLKDREITKLVEVPPYSTGYWIYIAATAISSALLTILLY